MALSQIIQADDSIFLSTVDGPTAGQNINISSSANFFAPNEILIDAGDDVSIAAGASIQTGLLNINADADPSDPDAVGGATYQSLGQFVQHSAPV